MEPGEGAASSQTMLAPDAAEASVPTLEVAEPSPVKQSEAEAGDGAPGTDIMGDIPMRSRARSAESYGSAAAGGVPYMSSSPPHLRRAKASEERSGGMRGEQTTENKAKFDRDSPARGARFDGKRMLAEPLTAPLKGIISPRFSRKSKFSRSHRRTRSDPLCFKTLSGALSELTEEEDEEEGEDAKQETSPTRKTSSPIVMAHHQLNTGKDRTKNALADQRNAMLLEIRRNQTGLRAVPDGFNERMGGPRSVRGRTRMPSPLSKSSLSKSSLSSTDSVSSLTKFKPMASLESLATVPGVGAPGPDNRDTDMAIGSTSALAKDTDTDADTGSTSALVKQNSCPT